jgi:hypothetical protein
MGLILVELAQGMVGELPLAVTAYHSRTDQTVQSGALLAGTFAERIEFMFAQAKELMIMVKPHDGNSLCG